MQPKLSIIMVHFKDIQGSQSCLNSIKDQTNKDFETIIVDNSPDHDSKKLDINGLQNVKVIDDAINYGYGKACNIASAHCHGDYILVLNNDLELDRSFIGELSIAVGKNPEIGMFAPKIYLADRGGVLDSVGMKIYWDGIAKQRGHLEIGLEKYNVSEEVLFPSGCTAVYKNEMLNEIGFFDEDFFLYCEDTDLGLRAQLAGWKCLYVPKAAAYHKYSASSDPYSVLKAFYVERNRSFVVIKNYPLILLPLAVYFTFKRWFYQLISILTMRGMAGKFVKKSSFCGLVLTVLRAYFSFFYLLPMMLKKRRQNRKLRRISDKAFYSILKKHLMPVEELVFKG